MTPAVTPRRFSIQLGVIALIIKARAGHDLGSLRSDFGLPIDTGVDVDDDNGDNGIANADDFKDGDDDSDEDDCNDSRTYPRMAPHASSL